MNPRVAIWVIAMTAWVVSGVTRSGIHVANTSHLSAFPGWDRAPLLATVHPIPLSPRDLRFAQGFPGKIGAFADDSGTYLARWLTTPTRLLHSSRDCLRGAGYSIRPGMAWSDNNHRLWASFTAERAGVRLRVRERIVSADEQSWTDVSAWYWSALFGRSRGPWWAITVMETEP